MANSEKTTRRAPEVTVRRAPESTALRAPESTVLRPRHADPALKAGGKAKQPQPSKRSGGLSRGTRRPPKARKPRQVRFASMVDAVRILVEPLGAKVRKLSGVVSMLGWVLFGLMVFCWVLAVWFGWVEFGYATVVLALILAISVLFCLGRLRLDVRLEVDPLRVSVGDSAAAQLTVTNKTKAPTLSLGAELPVGLAVARYTIPPLAPSGEHSELALIPTQRRGVIDVGPVTTQRGDPFRIFRREVEWTQRYELFIHPRTVMLDSLGSGLLRDLEGRTTNDVSMSDLEFHTLRPYEIGDDRRYIHWRSSAKLSEASGQDMFLVRQFLDTRRSHVAVLVDVDPASYSNEEDFELAISAGASIAVRALTDKMDLTIVAGKHAAVQPPPHTALDTFSRAEFQPYSLTQAANWLNQLASDVSSVVLCTGTNATLQLFLQAKAYLAPEIGVVALQAHQGAQVGLREANEITIVTMGALVDLSRAVAAGVAA